MKAYLLNIWDDIVTSYWLVPALFATAALALSFAIPALDSTIARHQDQNLPQWVQVNADTARATLSAIAGAMVAVTGTVFSITIVTLSLTSQQFGPRLIRRFMYDIPTKITLGSFIATGFYCLLVLRVGQQSAVEAPHHLSVLVAVVMAVISMAMLIVFIHHIAVLIQAPHVVATVAADLQSAIDRLFPAVEDDAGDSAILDEMTSAGLADVSQADARQSSTERENWQCNSTPIVLHSIHEGYIQAIDYVTLRRVAAEFHVVMKLLRRPGHFISKGTPIAEVCAIEDLPSEQLHAERPCDHGTLACQLNDAIITGIRRTPRQDVECVVDELVEVAVRSLSPGINDPFTATNCIDRLGAAMAELARRPPLQTHWANDHGRLCLITHPVRFCNVLDAAFNQIRQYGADSVSVVVRLLEAFTSIAREVHREQDQQALLRHIDIVARLADHFPTEHDRDAIEKRAEEARLVLQDPNVEGQPLRRVGPHAEAADSQSCPTPTTSSN